MNLQFVKSLQVQQAAKGRTWTLAARWICPLLDGSLMRIMKPPVADSHACGVHASWGRLEVPPPPRFLHLGIATVMQPDEKLFKALTRVAVRRMNRFHIRFGRCASSMSKGSLMYGMICRNNYITILACWQVDSAEFHHHGMCICKMKQPEQSSGMVWRAGAHSLRFDSSRVVVACWLLTFPQLSTLKVSRKGEKVSRRRQGATVY